MALKFGQEAYPVALIARDAKRLSAGVSSLTNKGIHAQAFIADLHDVTQVQAVIKEVRAAMGPIGILHWNAFVDADGDLLNISVEDLCLGLSVRVVSYIAAVQACIDDLEANQGAVLATNGITAMYGMQADAFAKDYSLLAIPAAAQHKANGLLNQTLALRGVYVGEILLDGFVKGSASASQHGVPATIDPRDIAEQFWQLNASRQSHSTTFSDASRP